MKLKSNAKYNEPVESGTIFETKAGRINIKVHKIIHCEGWFLTCREIGIERKELKSETLIGAAKEARELVKKFVAAMKKDIDAICTENIEISRH